MFEKNPYNHSIIRKTISAFGSVFSGITIQHFNSDDELVKMIQCPIAYSPKESWFYRLNEDPEFLRKFETELPRISYEMVNIVYDPIRKQSSKNVLPMLCGENGGQLFSPAPWKIFFSLYTYTKTQEESFQIMEQVLPFFGPSLIVNINILPSWNISIDVPITLESVSLTDSYESGLSTNRLIQQKYDFSVDILLFGPTDNNFSVIKEITTNTMIDPSGASYNAEVNPRSAKKEDSYEIIEKWTDL